MAFKCPACGEASSLRITRRLELPGDARSDEITLQIVRCADCSFAGIAVYQESRRGSLSDDSFDHTGYYLDRGDLQKVQALIGKCARPGNKQCDCAAHRQLGRKDQNGRWVGLDDWQLKAPFPLRRG